MNWTKKFEKSYREAPKDNRLCRLCEMVHKNFQNEIVNIEKWWVYGSSCQENYAEILLEEDSHSYIPHLF